MGQKNLKKLRKALTINGQKMPKATFKRMKRIYDNLSPGSKAAFLQKTVDLSENFPQSEEDNANSI